MSVVGAANAVCSLPLKRGGLGWGSIVRFALLTPSLPLPLSGGGDTPSAGRERTAFYVR